MITIRRVRTRGDGQRRGLRSVALAVLAAFALALTAPGPAVAGALVAAHRGGALLWPENSLAAFRGSLMLGADFVETDVHLTSDGEVVVVHDPTLERTTTGAGRVRERTASDVAAVRLLDRSGEATAEPVPTLDAVLAIVAPSAARLLLEIKVDADGARYPGIEAKVVERLRAHHLVDRTVVMAFEPQTIATLRALAPGVRGGLLIGRRQAGEGDFVRRARDAGAAYLGLDHRLVTPGVVAEARATGVSLGAWTVNEEPDIRRVLDAGVDVVISDRPDLAIRLAR